jgi:hypothetical protein
MGLRCALLAAVFLIATAACAPLTRYEPRLARSSVGCMQAARARSLLPGQPDYVEHCMAAGTIARYCSVTEAAMASVGKEVIDVFTAGDAEWRDLMSDKRGVSCARHSQNDVEMSACCNSAVARNVAGH